jgi:hypothetical protein
MARAIGIVTTHSDAPHSIIGEVKIHLIQSINLIFIYRCIPHPNMKKQLNQIMNNRKIMHLLHIHLYSHHKI